MPSRWSPRSQAGGTEERLRYPKARGPRTELAKSARVYWASRSALRALPPARPPLEKRIGNRA